MRDLAKKRGYTIVAEQKYAPPTKDFSSLILALKSAGAEAIYSVPTPPQSIMIVKQMKELNYAPKVTCFIRGPDLSTYWDAMGKDANYVISDGNWDETMKYPGNDRVVKDYRAKDPEYREHRYPRRDAPTRPCRSWPRPSRRPEPSTGRSFGIRLARWK